LEDDNRIATHNAAAVTYDNDGNLLTDEESNAQGLMSKAYSYNARNFLTQTVLTNSTASTNLTVSYSYDVLGNRISSTVAGGGDPGTVTFVVNPNASLSQVLVREKNGQKTFYIYGLGLEYEVSQSGAVRYYHYDQIGSTVALSDGAGQVTDRMEYSPYGTVTHRAGTNDTPFLYVGKYGVQTDANGLLYMRARYYSPLLSRFLNSDPIGFGGGLNFFAYAGGNPFGYIDPKGLNTYGTDGTWYDVGKGGNSAVGQFLKWAEGNGEIVRYLGGPGSRPGSEGTGNWWQGATGSDMNNKERGQSDNSLIDPAGGGR
jgi:RHS repeat-associated protein